MPFCGLDIQFSKYQNNFGVKHTMTGNKRQSKPGTPSTATSNFGGWRLPAPPASKRLEITREKNYVCKGLLLLQFFEKCLILRWP